MGSFEHSESVYLGEYTRDMAAFLESREVLYPGVRKALMDIAIHKDRRSGASIQGLITKYIFPEGVEASYVLSQALLGTEWKVHVFRGQIRLTKGVPDPVSCEPVDFPVPPSVVDVIDAYRRNYPALSSDPFYSALRFLAESSDEGERLSFKQLKVLGHKFAELELEEGLAALAGQFGLVLKKKWNRFLLERHPDIDYSPLFEERADHLAEVHDALHSAVKNVGLSQWDDLPPAAEDESKICQN